MFTFNGIHADTYGVKVVNVDRSPLPKIENTLLSVPNRSGSYFIRNRLSQREINVEVKVISKSESDLREKTRGIGMWLLTSTPKQLVFDDEIDKQYFAVVDSAELKETLTLGEGTIKFICPSPYAESTTMREITLTSGDTTSFMVNGTAECYPSLVVKFTGNTTNFTYSYNGKTISLTKNFVNTDVLIINHSAGIITLNGTNILPVLSLSSDFFAINAGVATITASTFTGTAILSYKNRWI